MGRDVGTVVEAFNTFPSTAAAGAWRGRDACLVVWADSSRRYRNVFNTTTIREARVIVTGYSVCTEPSLNGQAIWTAEVSSGRIAGWRVYDDTASARKGWGLRERRRGT